MPRPKLVLSTCGTSVITNDTDADTHARITKLANAKRDDLTDEEKNFVDRLAKSRKETLLRKSLGETRKMSAEINGIAAIYDDRLSDASADQHIFLQTDTYLGEKAIDILNEWAKKNNISAQPEKIADLNTASLESFRSAMRELARWCYDLKKKYKQHHIVFNLTGGFKSVQGFMQTFGMLYADEVVYIFEGAKDLLRIPRLPLEIEKNAMEVIGNNVILFRQMDNGKPVKKVQYKIDYDIFFDNYDEAHYMLSPWGEIFWGKFREKKYGEIFFEESPMPEKFIYEASFLKAAGAFKNDAEKTRELNERMDDLMKYFVTGYNPKRLNFKKLTTQNSGCTHECYAWSTGGAWRVFCFFDGDICHIKELRKHL